MEQIATTKMSAKGQVVIPEKIRKQLDLKTGSRFIVLGDKDVVILKTISAPPLEEFEVLVSKANKQAEQVGMKTSDITSAISRARRHY